jgi:hypothetical protein
MQFVNGAHLCTFAYNIIGLSSRNPFSQRVRQTTISCVSPQSIGGLFSFHNTVSAGAESKLQKKAGNSIESIKMGL